MGVFTREAIRSYSGNMRDSGEEGEQEEEIIPLPVLCQVNRGQQKLHAVLVETSEEM